MGRLLNSRPEMRIFFVAHASLWHESWTEIITSLSLLVMTTTQYVGLYISCSSCPLGA